MKITKELLKRLIAIYCIFLVVLIVVFVAFIDFSQRKNLHLFNNEFYEIVRELSEREAVLFFNIIDGEIISCQVNSQLELLRHISDIDPTGKNTIIYFIDKKKVHSNYGKQDLLSLINIKGFDYYLQESLTKGKKVFYLDNYNEIKNNSQLSVVPKVVHLKIYEDLGLIIAYGNSFKTGKVRLNYLYKKINNNFIWYVCIAVAIFLVLSTVSLVVTIRIMDKIILEPLEELHDAFGRIGSGSDGFNVSVNIDREDEIGALAMAFNNMVIALNASLEELEESNKFLEQKVAERTVELEQKNEDLKKEMQEKEKLEHSLQQSQKLEAIGTLAAGIAHEINTPIQYINDNVTFVQDQVSSLFGIINKYKETLFSIDKELSLETAKIEKEFDLVFILEEVPQAIKETLAGIEKVSKIVGAMKSFSNIHVTERTSISISDVINNAVIISKNEWKYFAEIDVVLSPEINFITCYALELEQVILNLIINAVHAMEEKVKTSGEKGKIVIETKKLDNNMLRITVSDNGTGIPDEVKDKVFEPFFTTKDIGKGSGQGLSMAYNTIVHMHKGNISLETELGKGTTFILDIPL